MTNSLTLTPAGQLKVGDRFRGKNGTRAMETVLDVYPYVITDLQSTVVVTDRTTSWPHLFRNGFTVLVETAN